MHIILGIAFLIILFNFPKETLKFAFGHALGWIPIILINFPDKQWGIITSVFTLFVLPLCWAMISPSEEEKAKREAERKANILAYQGANILAYQQERRYKNINEANPSATSLPLAESLELETSPRYRLWAEHQTGTRKIRRDRT